MTEPKVTFEKETEKQLKLMDKVTENLSRLDAKISVLEDSDDEGIDDPLLSVLSQKSTYKVTIVGSGAREVMMINMLKKSKFDVKITMICDYINTSFFNTVENIVVIESDNDNDIIRHIKSNNTDIVIISDENRINTRLVDKLKNEDIKCIAPESAISIIGSDKVYLRQLLSSYNMEQFNPKYRHFGIQNRDDFLHYVTEELNHKFIIKHPLNNSTAIMDIDIKSIPEAEVIFNKMIDSANGISLVEETLIGEEFSIASFTDGVSVHHSPVAKKYTRISNNNTGINTNGSGCITMPNLKLPFLTDDDISVAHNIINNVIMALQEETKLKYTGIIQGNFIKTINDDIKVVGFSCNIGELEALSILGIMESDFMEIIIRIANSSLNSFNIDYRHEATCVMQGLINGYPENNYLLREIYIDRNDISKILCNKISIDAPKHDKPLKYYPNKIMGNELVAVIGKGTTMQDSQFMALNLTKQVHGPITWRTDIGNDMIEFNASISLSDSKFICEYVEDKEIDKITELIKDTHNQKSVIKSSPTTIVKENKGYYTYTVGSIADKINILLDYKNKCDAYKIAGNELVNHCINETLAKGTFPSTFTFKFDMAKMNTICYNNYIKSVTKACKYANIKVLEGNVSENPHTLLNNKCSITGFMTGYISEPKKLFNIDKMRTGDLVYGICVQGLQSDGFRTLHNILKQTNIQDRMTIGQFTDMMKWALTVQPSYLMEFQSYMAAKIDMKCIIYVNNGGFINSVDKVLPSNFKMTLSEDTIIKQINQHMKTLAGYGSLALLDSFNCGFGMLFVVSPKDKKNIEIVNQHRRWNYVKLIGKITEKYPDEPCVDLDKYWNYQ